MIILCGINRIIVFYEKNLKKVKYFKSFFEKLLFIYLRAKITDDKSL